MNGEMANPLETSFIPQQPLLKAEGTSARREPLNTAMVVSLVVFFVTLAVTGGMYYWRSVIVDTVEERKLALQDAESQFSIEQVRYYERLQVALDTAKKLVDEHTIFSTVFDLIERRVAQNIGLTGLQYAMDPQKGTLVTLKGQAPTYAALYFQIEQWKSTETVTAVELEDFLLDDTTGIVNFTATLSVDPASLHNAKVLVAEERKAKEAADALAATPENNPLPQ